MTRLCLLLFAAMAVVTTLRGGLVPEPLPTSPYESDLIEGRLTVSLLPERGLLDGHAVLWGRVYGPHRLFPFFLHSRALIKSVTLPDGTRLSVKRAGDRVDVCLPPRIRLGGHVGLVVDWAIRLGGPSMKGPICPYLTSYGAYFPSDLYWHPRGVGNDKATWRIMLRIPRKWKGICPGAKSRSFINYGKRCLSYRFDDPISGMAFIGGVYEESSRRRFWHGYVRSYTFPNTECRLAQHTRNACDVLAFFQRILGDPRFTGYTLVEVPGKPPFRACAEGGFLAVSAPPDRMTACYLEYLATELGRGWFERRLRFRDHLGEGLCVYLGMLAVRKFAGRKAFLVSARSKYEAFCSAASVGRDARPAAVRGLGENVDFGSYQTLVCLKVPLLLLCLEQRCGGLKSFVTVLRRFIHYYRDGAPVGWPELMDIIEKKVGIDLSDFSLLYLDGYGLPPGVPSIVGFEEIPAQSEKKDG